MNLSAPGRRLGALLSCALFLINRPEGLPASPAGKPAKVQASCELGSSGAFSLTLSRKGDIGWRLALLLPSGDGIASFVPPIAFRAGCAIGPFFLGSIALPEELTRLKDVLSRPVCPLLESKSASEVPITLDDRDLSLHAAPGIQETPGAAIDALFPLPFPGAERVFRVKLGAFPSGGLPRLGASLAYSSEPSSDRGTGLRFEVNTGFLAGKGAGAKSSNADDPWFLDSVPPLPRDFPIRLGQVHTLLGWGPVALAAGIYVSESAFATPAWYGESGIKVETGGLSALVAGRFPIAPGPDALPLLDAEGMPSGACEWAPAGIDGSWRWEIGWKSPIGCSSGVFYEGLTGRALSRRRLYLPRREKAGARAAFSKKTRVWGGEIELSCGRVLDWMADGLAEAENEASFSASAEFLPWGRKARGSAVFSLGSELALSMEEGRAPGPGPEGRFLVLVPGTMIKTKEGLSFAVDCGGSFAFAEMKASASFSGEGAPQFSFRAESLLPFGAGRALLSIGPGESASLGWKSR